MIREINASEIINAIERLSIDSNYYLPNIKQCFIKHMQNERENSLAKNVMGMLIENIEIAEEEQVPICQDTGIAVVFVEIGQDVHICGLGDLSLEDAINEGVRRGYKNGYLRKSIVKHPIFRENTNDNTPAVIHYEIVKGDKLKISFMPKGFGSENMSAIKMLKPSDGALGIKQFVIETVKNAGSNPCPPIVVGVGIGGTMEKAAILSKKALLREIGTYSEDEYIKSLECELLEQINKLGIGAGGFGGNTTALGVSILTYPTHISGLPVSVNISCHAARHLEVVL